MRQYRHGSDSVTLEIPAGTVEKGEDALETARRELAEETGYGGGEWIALGRSRPNAAFQNNWCWHYLARGVAQLHEVQLDEGEDIAIVTRPLQNVPEMVRSGVLDQALQTSAFYAYEHTDIHGGASPWTAAPVLISMRATRLPLDAPFPVPGEDVCTVLRPWVLYPSWAACLLVLGAWLIAPDAVTRLQWAPLALSFIVFGLPHGALDHLVPARLRRRQPTPRRVAPVIAWYLALVVAYLLFWAVAPAVALVAFLTIALLHWGQGDYFVLLAFLRRPRPVSVGGMLVLWIVRRPTCPSPSPCLPTLPPSPRRRAAWAACGGRARRGRRLPPSRSRGWSCSACFWPPMWSWPRTPTGATQSTGWASTWARSPCCWCSSGRMPPAAVGVYFCLWHSTRHIARLMMAREANLGRLRNVRVLSCLIGCCAMLYP